MDGWHFAGNYVSRAACQSEGRQAVDGGYAEDWICEYYTNHWELRLWY